MPLGLEGEKQLLRVQQSASPDATIEIQDMIVEGNKVAARWKVRRTHEGEFLGVEPTGNDPEIDGFQVDQVENGQIDEKWVLFDALGIMQQMGVMP